jgi:hypothetical protein
MNKQIKEFERASGLEVYGLGANRDKWEAAVERFSGMIVQEVLELHTAGTDVPAYFGITASDGKESIDVEFSDEEILQYMKLAHERDITFNKFIELALRKAIEEHDLKEQTNES